MLKKTLTLLIFIFALFFLTQNAAFAKIGAVCTSSSNCEFGEICKDGKCAKDATTQNNSKCTSNANCASGQVCQNGSCVQSAVICNNNSKCKTGEKCINGTCTPQATATCTTNTDCSSNQVCQNGSCVTKAGSANPPSNSNSGTSTASPLTNPLKVSSAGDLLKNIINFVLGFVGVIAAAMIVYGGIIYMTSAGNDQRIGQAKSILTYGIVGLIISLTAGIIVQLVITAVTG